MSYGGPIPRGNLGRLHKQVIFNDFDAYELKLAASWHDLRLRSPLKFLVWQILI